jgi:hypothetical protein
MLLYVVVTVFFLIGENSSPIVTAHGNEMMGREACEKAASIQDAETEKLIRKNKVPLRVETSCARYGVSI